MRFESGELPEDLLCCTHAARLVPSRTGGRLHVNTLYRWISQGRLRAWKLGPTVYVSRAELLALFEPAGPALDPGLRARRASERRQRALQEQWTAKVLRGRGLPFPGGDGKPAA
jgi:excisionase family DNA binding protein